MNKIYLLLLTGILLFSLATYNYNSPTQMSVEHYCESNRPLCVTCPLFTTPVTHHRINPYTYILSQGSFVVLVSKLGITFKKTHCLEYLKAISPSLTWQANQYLDQLYKQGEIYLTSSHSVLFSSLHVGVASEIGDLIIFSKNEGNIKPSVYIQGTRNTESLLKYARMMGWSSLLALIAASTANKLGYPIFSIGQQLPLLQMVAVATSLLSSSDQSYFNYVSVPEAMYLVAIYLKIHQNSKGDKGYLAAWIAICAFSDFILTIGQFYIVLSLRKQTTNIAKMLLMMLKVGLVLKAIVIIIPLNFIIFVSVLWSIILLPICMLMMQDYQSMSNK